LNTNTISWLIIILLINFYIANLLNSVMKRFVVSSRFTVRKAEADWISYRRVCLSVRNLLNDSY